MCYDELKKHPSDVPEYIVPNRGQKYMFPKDCHFVKVGEDDMFFEYVVVKNDNNKKI